MQTRNFTNDGMPCPVNIGSCGVLHETGDMYGAGSNDLWSVWPEPGAIKCSRISLTWPRAQARLKNRGFETLPFSLGTVP